MLTPSADTLSTDRFPFTVEVPSDSESDDEGDRRPKLTTASSARGVSRRTSVSRAIKASAPPDTSHLGFPGARLIVVMGACVRVVLCCVVLHHAHLC
jgi:hypothetical protein